MSIYVQVPFREAVRDATGGNPKVQRREYLPEGSMPVLDQGQKFIAGYTTTDNAYSGRLPVVLFGDHTRTFKYVDFPFALGADGVKVLAPQEGFEASFLYYYLRNADIPSAGYSRHFKFLRELSVCKPPLTEQRRIVSILNRAAKIERLRTQAQERLREFIPALFMKMFGDQYQISTRYPQMALREIAEIASGITKGRKIESESLIKVPYLRVANVQDGFLNLEEIKTIAIRRGEEQKYALVPGDLVMTEGGDPDKLGRAAVWNGELSYCAHQNHVFRVRPHTEMVLTDYLRDLAGSVYGKAYFLSVAKRTTGIASVNKTQLGGFPVPVPPMELQALYAKTVATSHDIASIAETVAGGVAALSSSLMSCLLGNDT